MKKLFLNRCEVIDNIEGQKDCWNKILFEFSYIYLDIFYFLGI